MVKTNDLTATPGRTPRYRFQLNKHLLELFCRTNFRTQLSVLKNMGPIRVQ
jgi:hypothetical protein